MSIPQSGGGPIESYDQLVNYLADGCKPKEDWRIGTENEKFGYNKETLLPLPYEGDCSIRAMLEGLRDGHGWDPVEEGGKLIGLVKDGANISLEPGGQLELSGAPVETIHETCDEVNTHLREVRDVADRIGAGFIGLGAAPEWSHDQMDLMPKGRYKLMNEYMTKVGTMGRVMMRRTCTVQVNLDFGSEADMVQKLRVALALQVAEVFLRLLDGSEGNDDDDDDGQAIQLSLPFRSLELHGKTAEWWSWCREMFEESCTMSLTPDY